MSRRGRVYQRVKGRGNPWSFVVDVASDGAPRKQMRRHGFATQKAAQEELTNVLASLQQGTFVARQNVTFGEWLHTWFDQMSLHRRPTTMDSYERQLRNHVWSSPIANIQLQKLQATDLDELYGRLLVSGNKRTGGPLSNRSVLFLHCILHKALKDALRKKLIKWNPADGADAPSAKDSKAPRQKVWDVEQSRRFLEFIKDDGRYLLWRTYVLTGGRRGEGLGLRWADIHWSKSFVAISQSVTIVKGKVHIGPVKSDGSARPVDLDPQTMALLKKHKAAQAKNRLAFGAGYRDDLDLVFAEPDGSPINPKTVTKRWGRLCTLAGLPTIRLHDARHTHATLLLDAGESIGLVQERLGHASSSFTQDIYGHVLPGRAAAAAASLSSLLDAPASADNAPL